ncbi:MAG: tetratricopeptide repeat protein [Deltaproteobacteria bacterium]|jgi:tetratricopeptide (TPR) repeat protein|nr:tetratricopeptide repeat protein [Deltaproteobacteria bacterium]
MSEENKSPQNPAPNDQGATGQPPPQPQPQPQPDLGPTAQAQAAPGGSPELFNPYGQPTSPPEAPPLGQSPPAALAPEAPPLPPLDNFTAPEDIPTLAATSRLKTFSSRREEKTAESAAPQPEEAPSSEAPGTEATEANPESPPQATAGSNLGPTIHSETNSVANLDLSAPGPAPTAKAGNLAIRSLSNACQAIVKLWKRVPPIDDLFDMLLTALGFQRNPTSMLRRAQSLAAKGRHADAIKWFREILTLRPLTIAAYDGLGRVYFRMGLTEEANREFTIADCLERLVNNRDDLDAACALSTALLEKKQAKMAVSLLEPVLIAHFYTPNNATLLKKMGLVYAELRSTKKLYQVYEAGLAQYPNDHEFHILKGNLEVKLGRVAEGEKLIRYGRLMGRLKEDPEDVNANMSMGELCVKENRLPEGLSFLREAARLSPGNSGIRWRLFNLYQKQGNYPDALHYFLEVLDIEPDNEELKYKLADFYRKNQRLEEARVIFQEMADKHPREPKPRYLLSGLLSDMGRFEEAQSVKNLADMLAIGKKLDPDHREIVTFMKYLFSVGQNKEAVEWLDRGLARWPYHGELIITKVKLLYNEYRYKDAVTLLKRLISVKNDLAEPHMWIAMCYQRLGNHMAALAEAQLATRLAPKSFTSHKILGDILKEQKKVSQANAAYEVANMIQMSLKNEKKSK